MSPPYSVLLSKLNNGLDGHRSAKGLEGSAKRLEASTGGKCIPAPADVRQPDQLKDAVKRTQEAFGRIDFVICGMSQ